MTSTEVGYFYSGKEEATVGLTTGWAGEGSGGFIFKKRFVDDEETLVRRRQFWVFFS